MNTAFHTAPLSVAAWGRVLAVAAAVFVLVEVETWWVSRPVAPRPARSPGMCAGLPSDGPRSFPGVPGGPE